MNVPAHRGTAQGKCCGCGRIKGSHDRNAGWYELGRRGSGNRHGDMLFCPPCAGALLVGLDERLSQGRKNPNLVAVLSGDLRRLKDFLEVETLDERAGARRFLEWVCGVLPGHEATP